MSDDTTAPPSPVATNDDPFALRGDAVTALTDKSPMLRFFVANLPPSPLMALVGRLRVDTGMLLGTAVQLYNEIRRSANKALSDDAFIKLQEDEPKRTLGRLAALEGIITAQMKRSGVVLDGDMTPERASAFYEAVAKKRGAERARFINVYHQFTMSRLLLTRISDFICTFSQESETAASVSDGNDDDGNDDDDDDEQSTRAATPPPPTDADCSKTEVAGECAQTTSQAEQPPHSSDAESTELFEDATASAPTRIINPFTRSEHQLGTSSSAGATPSNPGRTEPPFCDNAQTSAECTVDDDQPAAPKTKSSAAGTVTTTPRRRSARLRSKRN